MLCNVAANVCWINERAIRTEIQVIEGVAVSERIQADVGLTERPPPANASAVSQTHVISIAVREANAANAATYAKASAEADIDILQVDLDSPPDDAPQLAVLVSQLASFNRTLEQLRIDAALRTGGDAVIKSAGSPKTPVEPTPTFKSALASIVGLLIGLRAAFLLVHLDEQVKSEDEPEVPPASRCSPWCPSICRPAAGPSRSAGPATKLSRPTGARAPTGSSCGSVGRST